MKQHQQPPAEQKPFIVILAGRGGRRFRNVLQADNAEDAHAKATAMAEMLSDKFEVTHVRPAVDHACSPSSAN